MKKVEKHWSISYNHAEYMQRISMWLNMIIVQYGMQWAWSKAVPHKTNTT